MRLRRIRADVWAGIAMFAVVIGAASPVLLRFIDPVIPHPAWVALFVIMLVAIAVSVMGTSGRPRTYAWFALAVVSSWALLLTAHGSAGFFPIVVIVLASVSVYLVPRRVTAVIVTGNTIVLAVASFLSAESLVEITLVTLLYLLLQIGTVLSSVAILREQRMRERLSAANIELQAANVLLEESTRTAERLRIARDLHDSIGHQLTVLNLTLEAARHSDGAAAREQVEKASSVTREVLGDLRATVSEMRDEPADLVAALQGVVSGTPGLEVSVRVDDDVQVNRDIHEVLVRAVQEIATNTLRHADAETLWILVGADADGSVRLEATDDGRGSAHPIPGNGLRGMIERFDAIGGDVELNGSGGFTIRAKVPVHD